MTGPTDAGRKRRLRKREAAWLRKREARRAAWRTRWDSDEHIWAPHYHVDIIFGGCWVMADQYFDAFGMKCGKCKRVVWSWTEQLREDSGKIERRYTGHEIPKRGCPGVLEILLVG